MDNFIPRRDEALCKVNRGGCTGGVDDVREDICTENMLNIKDFDPLKGYRRM
jgi:hypothetical protein